jgi:hypothetical protein
VLAPSAPRNGWAAGNWQKSEHCWTPLRLKKRPAGGPQLRKSGGPQPRKLGGPQPRKFCSNFSNREATLQLLEQLHSVTVAEHDEVMTFIRAQKLYGWGGVGYVDVHLLAAAAIDRCQFWTLDKRLKAVAANIGIVVNS